MQEASGDSRLLTWCRCCGNALDFVSNVSFLFSPDSCCCQWTQMLNPATFGLLLDLLLAQSV